MSEDDAIALLTNAMLAETRDASALVSAVRQVQSAGLDVRAIYDEARENAARGGRYAPSYRELVQSQTTISPT
jgi:hypothetical protein